MNPIENFEAAVALELHEWFDGNEEYLLEAAKALTGHFTENARLLGEQVIGEDDEQDPWDIKYKLRATQRQALHKLTGGGEE